jgi:pimeloyl-ACP methyl ester carboxylesterase
MESLTIGNRRVSYRFYGRDVDAQRPPVVLLHGAGGNHLVWPAQVRHLANTAVYALDLPGHGASPGPGASEIGIYSEIVRDFVDSLELPWFLLAGHSMGGAIALDFALAYSQRLAAIAAVGTGARMRVAPALLEGVLQDFDAATEQIVECSYRLETPPAEKELYLRHLRENDPHVLYSDFVACHNFDVVDRLATLTTPSLFICGRQDRMTPPERSIYLRNHVAGSELLVIEDAGHNVMVERPQPVADALQAFLAKVTA